jgi:hypothetical protein
MSFLEYLLPLLTSTLAMALWIAVIVFGAVKLKRGGGRAERFLIAGGSIKLAGNLLIVPMLVITSRIFNQDYINSVHTAYSILRDAISMAGIICLVYAFWAKFKAKEVEVS